VRPLRAAVDATPLQRSLSQFCQIRNRPDSPFFGGLARVSLGRRRYAQERRTFFFDPCDPREQATDSFPPPLAANSTMYAASSFYSKRCATLPFPVSVPSHLPRCEVPLFIACASRTWKGIGAGGRQLSKDRLSTPPFHSPLLQQQVVALSLPF